MTLCSIIKMFKLCLQGTGRSTLHKYLVNILANVHSKLAMKEIAVKEWLLSDQTFEKLGETWQNDWKCSDYTMNKPTGCHKSTCTVARRVYWTRTNSRSCWNSLVQRLGCIKQVDIHVSLNIDFEFIKTNPSIPYIPRTIKWLYR